MRMRSPLKCCISVPWSAAPEAEPYTPPVSAQAVKWFPDRRGLAVGLTAAGYGAGAALTVVPIRAVIGAAGYEAAFFWFGLVQGGMVFILAWVLRAPDPGEIVGIASPKVPQTARSYTPRQALGTPVFWVLYIMFVMVSASGLMATAQIAPIAKDFNVGDVVILFGASALTVALIVDNVCNGGARPLFGWISDQIGREYTMAIAFGLGGIAYWLLGTLGHAPWAFVVFVGPVRAQAIAGAVLGERLRPTVVTVAHLAKVIGHAAERVECRLI
jgi:OFA family oxalate/formate antiporter-like MFS transporter